MNVRERDLRLLVREILGEAAERLRVIRPGVEMPADMILEVTFEVMDQRYVLAPEPACRHHAGMKCGGADFHAQTEDACPNYVCVTCKTTLTEAPEEIKTIYVTCATCKEIRDGG